MTNRNRYLLDSMINQTDSFPKRAYFISPKPITLKKCFFLYLFPHSQTAELFGFELWCVCGGKEIRLFTYQALGPGIITHFCGTHRFHNTLQPSEGKPCYLSTIHGAFEYRELIAIYTESVNIYLDMTQKFNIIR